MKKRLEADNERARIVALAKLDQEERAAKAPKIVASQATKIGSGEIKKFQPAEEAPGGS